ncbi:hypothetical protein JY651_04495 [Pyxidicoccus parkwayensis]|uniref:Uncharacterized protein n=1 Tax=Pyxidicoccus parkwayensis TaxID=2813578 RepID=A0ABX7P205_9BACT|nr:hypothetical protein [Pyxidicoccus parkwaysis]QSQ24229.1 hypothetical protein JY651_04495 [Pyxidicoccus parkwaysis]
MDLKELIPLITFMLGAVLTLVTEATQYQRQVKREREARAAERADQQARATAEFQVQTMLALQESLSKVISHMQQRVFSGQLSEAEFKELTEAQVRTLVLKVRVQDDALRQRVERLTAVLIELAETREPARVSSLWSEAFTGFHEANERIGVLLRAP